MVDATQMTCVTGYIYLIYFFLVRSQPTERYDANTFINPVFVVGDQSFEVHVVQYHFDGFFSKVLGYPRIVQLWWRHNGHHNVSNHQPHDRLLNRLFRRRSKKTSKLRITGLCAGKSPWTGEFPAQMSSNAWNVSIWWRHHAEAYFRCR